MRKTTTLFKVGDWVRVLDRGITGDYKPAWFYGLAGKIFLDAARGPGDDRLTVTLPCPNKASGTKNEIFYGRYLELIPPPVKYRTGSYRTLEAIKWCVCRNDGFDPSDWCACTPEP